MENRGNWQRFFISFVLYLWHENRKKLFENSFSFFLFFSSLNSKIITIKIITTKKKRTGKISATVCPFTLKQFISIDDVVKTAIHSMEKQRRKCVVGEKLKAFS